MSIEQGYEEFYIMQFELNRILATLNRLLSCL